MKKVTSKQNIAIIVLSILLLISIIFGVTYSYFNGRSNELTNTGNITMATLKVEISGYDETIGQTTDFSLHTDGTKVVPGQPLSNTALQISNTSPVATYMAVVYSLKIITKDEEGKEVIIDAPSEMEAMDIQNSSVGDGWRKQSYLCNDGTSRLNLLVYLGGSDENKGRGYGIFPQAASAEEPGTSLVLDGDCLKVPESWGNDMQGKTVTLTFTAYIIQADAISNKYPSILDGEEIEEDAKLRTEAIANMFVSEFALDTTVAPSTTPEVPVE